MLNNQQYEQLLKPLNPSRVAKRSQAGRSLSYLESFDVKAHLIRIFGFGGWSAEVLSAELAFEDQNEKGQWNVGYKVTMRLTVHALGCVYTEAAVGSATLPQRGEAHDMAVKTAESDALKRAAINLGTQFGLSLYNDGSLKDVVGQTLDREIFSAEKVEEPVKEDEQPISDTEGAADWYEQIKAAFAEDTGSKADRLNALMEIKKQMVAEDVNHWVYQNNTLGIWLDRAVAAVAKNK